MSKKKILQENQNQQYHTLQFFRLYLLGSLDTIYKMKMTIFYRCFPSSPTFTQSPLEVRIFNLPFHSVTKMGVGDLSVDIRESDGFTRWNFSI